MDRPQFFPSRIAPNPTHHTADHLPHTATRLVNISSSGGLLTIRCRQSGIYFLMRNSTPHTASTVWGMTPHQEVYPPRGVDSREKSGKPSPPLPHTADHLVYHSPHGVDSREYQAQLHMDRPNPSLAGSPPHTVSAVWDIEPPTIRIAPNHHTATRLVNISPSGGLSTTWRRQSGVIR